MPVDLDLHTVINNNCKQMKSDTQKGVSWVNAGVTRAKFIPLIDTKH